MNIMKSRLRGLGLTLLAAASTLPAAEPAGKPTKPNVKIDFTDKGELSLTLDGQMISQPSKTLEPTVRFRDPDAKLSIWGANDKTYPVDNADTKPQRTSYDAAKRQLTQTFAWGDVVRNYQVVPEGVNIEVTVRNNSPKTLAQFDQRLFTLKMPGNTGPATTTEALYFGQATPAAGGNTLSGPVALPLVGEAGWGDRGKDSRAVVATTPETKKHLALRWDTDTWVPPWERQNAAKKTLTGYAANDPVAMELALRQLEEARAEKGETWWLSLSVGGDKQLFHDTYASRPIAPGGSDTYTVWLRFGNASDPVAPAKEALEAYAKAHPMLFKWDDRRAIMSTMIGDKFPFHEPEGLELKKPAVGPRAEEIRTMLLKHADELIEEMKDINAQGVIVWNIEGNGPNYLQYVGDPHMVEYLCPEADAVADEFFKKIRDAGFKVGVCLRPSVISVKEQKNEAFAEKNNLKNPFSYFHDYPHDKRPPADILAEKVEYAKRRWGCTMFYVDTNHAAGFWPKTDEEKAAWPKEKDGKLKWYNELLNEDVWAEVLKRHPDVLFTIEHTPLIQYTVSAPYDEWQTPADGTPAVVRATWPDAFKCLVIKEPKDHWKVAARVEKGDVLSGSGPALDLLNKLGENLKAGPPKELAGIKPEQLVSVATDSGASESMRFFAAKKLCEGEPDAATVEQLLKGKDALVQLIAVESLKTRDQIKAQLPLLTKLKSGKYGFFGGPLRDAIRRGGPEVLGDLANFARSTPASFNGIVEMLSVMPGNAATQQMVNLMNDTTLKDNLRIKAAIALGWRKDATKEQEDAVLSYLLPMLNDPKARPGIALQLKSPYLWQHGLWFKNPRVLEAAKTALAAEQAQSQPNKACVDTLEDIIKGRR